MALVQLVTAVKRMDMAEAAVKRMDMAEVAVKRMDMAEEAGTAVAAGLPTLAVAAGSPRSKRPQSTPKRRRRSTRWLLSTQWPWLVVLSRRRSC